MQPADKLVSGAAESNRRVFDSAAGSYVELALMPAERRVLALLGPRLHEMDMLDLGVGAGRTGYTFAPLVRRYVGVDFAPRMLERARELLGEDDNVTLALGTASDLSIVDGQFDFALFSFNGIDAVGHEDRLAILSEVRRVLRPNGYFLFSTHSTGALPLSTRPIRSSRLSGSRAYALYALVGDARYARGIRKINRGLDLEAVRERGWTIVPKMGHNFQIDDYYIDPQHQVEQLRGAGFEVEAIYDMCGHDVELPHRGRDPWLDYLCRPAAAA